ncbi:Calmodulin-binding transcription activator [Thalictrum thalictroides]|uniref:Calmodulin-binding transcription activator n=1 Tax=Thalictrum thalictroides TaxID=46969 RepID=A0A7J6W1C2_THATH|nr:Calmodulin-binding transcription activator [Thalictrum thalictroides]
MYAWIHIEQLLVEAQTRWLRPAEICEILRNYRTFHIAPEPPNKPPSGSLFIFNRKVLRYFRKDGHNWRKKKDGKTVREAHERLKAGSIDVLHCYYAHGEDNESFQRRSYWMLEEDYMHIVLVHYREVQGNKTNISRNRDTEEVVLSSQIDSPVSSSFVSNNNQVYSRATDTTSLNSAQTSECEEAESENNYQASSRFHSFPELQHYKDSHTTGKMDHGLFNSYFLPVPTSQYYKGKQTDIPGSNFVVWAGDSEGEGSNDAGFGSSYRTPNQLDMTSWGNVMEDSTSESYGASCVPSASSAQPTTMGYIPRQENKMLAQHSTDEHSFKMDDVNRPHYKEKWKMDHTLQIAEAYEQSTKLTEEITDYLDLRHAPESFLTHSANSVQNDHQLQFSDVDLGNLLKSDLGNSSNISGTINHCSDTNQLLSDNSKTEGLKKLDSFTHWMNNEFGEVDQSLLQSSSVINWGTVENENGVGVSDLSPEVHLDAYVLSTVLSQEQLFSIIDFSPSWGYTDSETKVLITGVFLMDQQDVPKCKWSCMFGEMEVPVEVLADGVFRCIAPPHKAGRVPFYVTRSNRLACSEVREFEFKGKYLQDLDMEDSRSGSSNEILLHIRLGKLLSLGSIGQPVASSVSERSVVSSRISSLMKEDDDDWLQMMKLTSEKEFSPGKVKDQLLQRILKEKLHSWLIQKVNEDGKGPNVLDKEGQGVLHLAAALGYDWAIAPTIATGVSINFRDVNGWTALHWAASCGRERTVVALLQLDAAPGALTDPSPKFPAGRTPADLASSNGHKGIAGFLAEASLTTHLSALNVKDSKEGEVPETGVKAIQTVSERTATPLSDGNVTDVSLKDSLTAVCNATQAAARIHQVFRVQSFQKKKFVEYDKLGISDKCALSLISVKTHRPGQHDEPVHTAAIRIQNKFRGWKGRKEFLLIRQRIVKLQAHVRGHQVRKHYKKIVWSVGIVEKAILRWRRKGSGLRGFRPDAHLEGSCIQIGPSERADRDFLKEGRIQTEERMQKALARVKSMVQYPEARDQYRRLLTVVTEFQEAKALSNGILNNSEESGDGYDDLINLEELLADNTFMSTPC